MADELLQYYQDELTYLRKLGADFKAKYPKIAERLVLDEHTANDPHVERLLEGFAFLTARVHRKIDDDFPEITDALLNIVYPHYLRPLPSMAVTELQLDPEQGKQTAGLTIPRGSMMFTRTARGVSCRFRTAYETTLWPIEVAAAEWKPPERLEPPVRGGGAVAAIRIELRATGEAGFDKLGIPSLRFYLHGSEELPESLYELLLNNCARILLRDPGDKRRAPVELPRTALRPVGFEENEALLPYPRRSFDGYRLLHEYFAFPQKYLFVELDGLREPLASFRRSVEIVFLLSSFEREDRRQKLEAGTNPRAFRLAATPIVNLFTVTSEPILLKQTQFEYEVVPDAGRRREIEVFSIDGVVSATPGSAEVIPYDPFFSFRHADDRQSKHCFWYATRRSVSWRPEHGSEAFLSLVDLSGRPLLPFADTLTCRLVCTNRDLPHKLPLDDEAGSFKMEAGGPVRKIVPLVRPTPSHAPPGGRGTWWRLVSHLSLNYLSLVSEGREAFQEILRLYDFTGATGTERQIQGITKLASSAHFARVVSEHGIAFARGTLVEVELDEQQFTGSGAYLFSSVLERFLGMYVSLNSFSQLSVRTPQRKEVLRRWPPRAGRKILL